MWTIFEFKSKRINIKRLGSARGKDHDDWKRLGELGPNVRANLPE
jgi:hypothetical protein